ncbi:DUF7305 domain-containing protein [Hyalangium versicolor]|uniref:DUF7305 domain-containing protein n=1 Tax=Hyalangium versicolor TaxID=2861190 RepID=UPI001CCC915F|nr:hypothetical protein [Hyalangium versicolor]
MRDPVAELPEPEPEPEPETCERRERAARLFTHSLCTCEALTASAKISTDAFQGSLGPWVPGGRGASIATNGDLTANEELQVGGSLWVAGTGAGIQLVARPLFVAGEFHSAGRLNGPQASVHVEGAASVAGDIDLASLRVDGTLSLPAERTLSVSGPLEVAELRREPVVPFASPCPCAATDLDDITTTVGDHAVDNDNASLPLDPDALAGFSGDSTLRLEAGRFYLRGISGGGTARLVVAGRSALFVDGAVSVGGLEVRLEEGAELDLFIAGGFSTGRWPGLDASQAPSRLRVYVTGEQQLTLPADISLVGNFYLPRTYLDVGAGAEIFGAVVARRVASSVPLSIHYDLDVSQGGPTCPPSAPSP